MKKIILSLMVLLLVGCQSEQIAQADDFTFVDDLGRTVSFKKPERVAALLGSYADIYYLAGGSVVASADDAWDDFNLPLGEEVINLGMTKDLNFEKLLESNPDLVLASSNTSGNVEWLESLESMNIPVLYYEVSNFEDYLAFLKVCTTITGRDDLYLENGENLKEAIEEIMHSSQEYIQNHGEIKVLSLRASSTFIRAKNSESNILGEMLKDLGCTNIADHDASLLENLSLEHIILQDPDYIFFIQQGDNTEGTLANIESFIHDNPAWSSLKAVQNDRVYILEKALYALKPNARWAEAYQKLEELICVEE